MDTPGSEMFVCAHCKRKSNVVRLNDHCPFCGGDTPLRERTMPGEDKFEELLDEHYAMLTEDGMDQRGVLACLINCTLNEADQEANQQTIAALERLRMEKKEKPKSKCLNAEQHQFGSCFECKKIDGYNRSVDDFNARIDEEIKRLGA